MEKRKFVFNDQKQKNSYGFYILTSGISLARFKDNPVMLDQHINYTAAVIGKWEDWAVEGELLCGFPVFDTGIEKGEEVGGQVERGFIKACSMGITFKHEDFQFIDDQLVLTKCELYEVSIVAVPSNANSIRLYADNGKVLTEEEVKSLCLSFTPENEEPEIIIKPDMSKIILSVATVMALGLDSKATDHDTTAVDAAVKKLSDENTQQRAKLLQLENAAEVERVTSVTQKVKLAIKEGKVVATKEADFIKLGIQSPELLDSMLEAIPTKTSLAAATQAASGTGEVKTLDDFMKLSLTEQLAFRDGKPDEYQKIVN